LVADADTKALTPVSSDLRGRKQLKMHQLPDIANGNTRDITLFESWDQHCRNVCLTDLLLLRQDTSMPSVKIGNLPK